MKTLTMYMFAALATLALFTDAEAAYTQLSSTNTTVGQYTKTSVVVQEGTDVIDQFTMYRVRLTNPTVAAKGAVLLMSPFGPGFAAYESHETSDYTQSIVGLLASDGFEVYGYSSRGQFLPDGYCTPLPLLDNCAAMADWGLATHARDGKYIRDWAASFLPGKKIVIGGYSLGAKTAMVAAGTYPNDFDAAIIWDGLLYTTSTSARNHANVWCLDANAQMLAGVYYENGSSKVFKTVATNAENDPDGLGHTTLVQFFSSPPPSPTTSPIPNYFFAAGDPLTNSFDFADSRRIYRSFESMAHYSATKVVQDVQCSIAGDRTLTSNFGNFTGPLYVIGGGHGFGQLMADNIALFGSTDVTWNYDSRYGHFDHFLHTDHYNVVEGPILNWLNTTVFVP